MQLPEQIVNGFDQPELEPEGKSNFGKKNLFSTFPYFDICVAISPEKVNTGEENKLNTFISSE